LSIEDRAIAAYRAEQAARREREAELFREQQKVRGAKTAELFEKCLGISVDDPDVMYSPSEWESAFLGVRAGEDWHLAFHAEENDAYIDGWALYVDVFCNDESLENLGPVEDLAHLGYILVSDHRIPRFLEEMRRAMGEEELRAAAKVGVA
jgi:hypothetical protein